jgi:hypothetical protein
MPLTISGPVSLKNGMSSFDPAIAVASKVLPEPGGPDIRMPFGGETPSHSKMVLCLIGHSIISLSCLITSSRPPTYANVTSVMTLAFSRRSLPTVYRSWNALSPSVFYRLRSSTFSASSCAFLTAGNMLFSAFVLS